MADKTTDDDHHLNGAPTKDDDLRFTTNLAQWMSLLPARLRQIPIIYLAIPGSHDTMTYGIGRGAAVAPDAETIITHLNFLMPCVVRRWARTQDLSTKAQLLAGIRYFDLRISKRRKDGAFYFVHGLFGERICGSLEQIAHFATENTGELVVLDCQHFYAFAADDYRRLASELVVLFGDRLYGPTDGPLHWLTLERAQAMGKQILIIFRNDAHIPAQFWPSHAWPTPWPDEIHVDRLQSYLDASLQQRSPGAGYVTQCVLTPPVRFILLRFYSSLRRACAETVRHKMFDWVRAQRPGVYRPGLELATANVFIADFVDLNGAEFCRAVVGLNAKLLADISDNISERL